MRTEWSQEKEEMKLKTLKDVEYWVSCSSAPGNTDGALRMEEELKEVAKEWIKILNRPTDKFDWLGKKDIQEFIKHFFNLEDEK